MGMQTAPAQRFYDFCLDDRTARRFGIKPRHLAADSAYGSAANRAWLVRERQIEPHIPVFGKSNRTDGTCSRSDFVFDAERIRDGELAAYIGFLIEESGMRLGVCDWGDCVYRAVIDTMQCQLRQLATKNAGLMRRAIEAERRADRAEHRSAQLKEFDRHRRPTLLRSSEGEHRFDS